MNEYISYGSYRAKVTYSSDDDLLIGTVADIEALISFSASSIKELKEEFQKAIDSYVEDCRNDHIEPEKPFKGSFNVRIGREAHRKAAVTAKKWNISLNEYVCIALEQVTDRYAPEPVAASISLRADASSSKNVYEVGKTENNVVKMVASRAYTQTLKIH